jgi:hypothetical protein
MKLMSLFLLMPVFSGQAFALVEQDVNDCEFVVDDFAVVNTAAYGATSSEVVSQLLVRPDLNQSVVEAGAFFHFAGTYKKITKQPDGSQIVEEWRDEDETMVVPAQRTIDGLRLKITFPQNWNTYGNDIGERRIKDFTFYVTIRQGESDVRFWFKDKDRNLSSESISAAIYPFSDPVFLGGYSNARYLWRDSGSPVFSNRAECLGN